MGMHEPGWRGRNYERAMEAWRDNALAECRKLREAAKEIEDALWANDSARLIGDATGRIEDASEALWKMREGPEAPEDA